MEIKVGTLDEEIKDDDTQTNECFKEIDNHEEKRKLNLKLEQGCNF